MHLRSTKQELSPINNKKKAFYLVVVGIYVMAIFVHRRTYIDIARTMQKKE